MNDLERVSFFQQSRTMHVTGNDTAIKFDHDAAGTDLQLFKQPSQTQPVRNFPFYSVDANLHVNKKPYPQYHLTVAREYGFKLVPICPAVDEAFGTVTFTLPYAGAIRIRFEGLPDYASGSQSAWADTPSSKDF